MRTFAVVLAPVLIVAALAAQKPEQKPSEDLTLKVDVDLVLFNVTVQDAKSNLVSGLNKDNFKIFEDGQQQDIDFFRPEDIPATVGLVIDNSGSMDKRKLEVIDAALSFAKASNPLDEVFIVNFNDSVWMGLPPGLPFTSDIDQLQRSLRSIRATGRTALYDALLIALDHLEKGRHQRKALVVLSDGGDNASTNSPESALLKLQHSDATVYTIGVYDKEDRDKNPGVLKKIAKQGGGEAYFPHSALELGAIWQKIAHGIRSQYTLGFTSRNHSTDGAYRHVLIRANGPDGKPLRVHAREGYRPGETP